MLAWDDFSGHKTERVKVCAEHECNTDLVFVPPGCTSLLQAPDLCWNKPFKANYRELYDEWSISGPKTYTPAGNMRPPTKAQCVEWVKLAWASVTQATIIGSFKCAAITAAVNGREDLLVTCLAENADIAREVRERLYEVNGLEEQPATGESQENLRGGLILSEGSDDDEFGGFEQDSLLC